eukprot:CAMPEP_0184684126 /NCGR_PEP_ID=MMETSP0312-20130426/13928_1 /TAXON_ID=31354 /ORGANISM="Compsopogon coeruleus, Strain SAG 36.94" /LENGTH=64 /DNA_ID=CAMNT_0027137003 /DNA_START=24 /DNA_END=214 /DNA_ORIENTATION=+
MAVGLAAVVAWRRSVLNMPQVPSGWSPQEEVVPIKGFYDPEDLVVLGRGQHGWSVDRAEWKETV